MGKLKAPGHRQASVRAELFPTSAMHREHAPASQRLLMCVSGGMSNPQRINAAMNISEHIATSRNVPSRHSSFSALSEVLRVDTTSQSSSTSSMRMQAGEGGASENCGVISVISVFPGEMQHFLGRDEVQQQARFGAACDLHCVPACGSHCLRKILRKQD